MRAVLKRIGKAISLAIADNIVTVPVAVAVVGMFHLHGRAATGVNFAITTTPFYFIIWAKEARHEHARQLERRHLGFA